MITIKATLNGGEEITSSFEEAIRIATLLNCYIEFEFNDVCCIGCPRGSVRKGVTEYQKVVVSENMIKIAMS